MKYYDHYILAQGGIHNITAFAVAFNFNFFFGRFHLSALMVSCFFSFAFDTCRFPIAQCFHAFMSVSLCLLVGCAFTGLHGPRMVGIVGGPDSFSLVIPFRLRDGCFSGSLHFMGLAWLSIVHLLCVVT
jgi:hypothetical protein